VRPITTPLTSWFSGTASLARARSRLSFDRRSFDRHGRSSPGRSSPRPAPVLFPARDRAWRALVPPFDDIVTLASHGLPFQIAAHRRYDRSGRVARLRPALRQGKTVFLPQVHQVLPRVMRLIVALRAAFMGPRREETSFLFLVEGMGREGLGLHHDGDVHAFWLQLEGRRTVTLGRPVPRGTPEELPDDRRDARATTRALPPGSLLYLPPRTPHRVVCYERSLALSLTWSVRRHGAFAAWDVTSGRVPAMPSSSRTRVWTQVPAVATRVDRHGVTFALPDGSRARMPAAAGRVARELGMMGSFPRGVLGAALPALESHGIVAPQDLPLVVLPDAPASLDGWRFA
jgi:hypothetical protein